MGDRLKTTAEAAEELAVNPEQVRRFVKDGELVAINVGRGEKRERLRFEDEAIAAFKLRRAARQDRAQCLPSTKTKNRNTSRPTSGSEVVSFISRLRKQASEKHSLSPSSLKKT